MGLRLVPSLAVGFLVVSCAATSGTGRGFGDSCDSDYQCSSGLMCKSSILNGICATGKTCTKTCSLDADCQSASLKSRCVIGCGDKVCVSTL